jgi:hypothetical protein
MIDSITFSSSSLASRKSAFTVRQQLESRITPASSKVEIDFQNVDSLSSSYADELFGVLAEHYGLDFISKKIKISNASPDVYYAIAHAINQRISSNGKAVA